jgi:hypothetical protein
MKPYFNNSNNNYDKKILSWEDLKWKNIYAVIEGHAVILKSPKNLDWIFWYGTHTCSLVIVEWINGELWLVHVHERIWKDDLIKFFWEFPEIKKIHTVWWSGITKGLIYDVTNNIWVYDNEFVPWQYDAVVYREWDENKIIITNKIPEIFRKDKVNEISSHIKSWLYIILTESIKDSKKWVPLIIENK